MQHIECTSANSSPSDLLVIYQTGYYGHGVHAITTSMNKALKLIRAATAQEADGQHIFHIFKIPINQKAPQKPIDDSDSWQHKDFGWMDFEPIYSMALNQTRSYENPAHPYQQPVEFLEDEIIRCQDSEKLELSKMANLSQRLFENGVNKECSEISFKLDSSLYFFVFKQGAYGHGVHAIMTSIEDACRMADSLASREVDDFHEYSVFTVPLNSLPEPNQMYAIDFGWFNKDPLYIATKAGRANARRQRHLAQSSNQGQATPEWVLHRPVSAVEMQFATSQKK